MTLMGLTGANWIPTNDRTKMPACGRLRNKNWGISLASAILFLMFEPCASKVISVAPGGKALAQGITSPLPPSNGVYQSVSSEGKVWFGTSKGLVRTVDGSSWTFYGKDTSFASPGIFSLSVQGDTILTATGFEKDIDGQSLQTGSGLTFSFDGGTTWHHVPQPLDGIGDSVILYGVNRISALPIIVPEQNVTFDISVFGRTIWTASWAGGVRKSTDGGATWRRVVLPPDTLNSISPAERLNFVLNPRNPPEGNRNHLAFSVAALNDSEVWAGTAGGVNYSSDGGISWRKFTYQNQINGILGNWVIAIKGQKTPTGVRIWTTNWPADDPRETYGVSYTEDKGQTWHNLLKGIKCYDFAFRDSVVFIATADGLYRTSDLGATWTKTNSIIDEMSRELITTSSVYTVSVVGDTVWIGTDDGIAQTVDQSGKPFGLSWAISRAYEPVEANSAVYVYPNPFSPNFERARIHYATSSPLSVVSTEIYDFAMNRVRTLLHSASRSGSMQRDEIWDGTDDNGAIVPNGVYFIRLAINDGEPLWAKVLVIR